MRWYLRLGVVLSTTLIMHYYSDDNSKSSHYFSSVPAVHWPEAQTAPRWAEA